MSDLVITFDTETTGLPDWKAPSESEHQPHLVEVAAILQTADGAVIDSYKAIVRPDGWAISDEIAKLTGITHEMAMEHGIPEAEALAGFLALYLRAGIRVAHNATFDDRIIRIAMTRYMGKEKADAFKDATKKVCTCYESRAACALPKNKLPTLAEAYKHFFGEDLAEAHRAMPDAHACSRIFFALKGIQIPALN